MGSHENPKPRTLLCRSIKPTARASQRRSQSVEEWSPSSIQGGWYDCQVDVYDISMSIYIYICIHKYIYITLSISYLNIICIYHVYSYIHINGRAPVPQPSPCIQKIKIHVGSCLNTGSLWILKVSRVPVWINHLPTVQGFGNPQDILLYCNIHWNPKQSKHIKVINNIG